MINHPVSHMLAAVLAASVAFCVLPAHAEESCSNGSPPPCSGGGGGDSGIGLKDLVGLIQPPIHLPGSAGDNWTPLVYPSPTFIPGFTSTIDYYNIKIGGFLGPNAPTGTPPTPPATTPEPGPGPDVQPVGGLYQGEAPEPTNFDWQKALESSPMGDLTETRIQMLPDAPDISPAETDPPVQDVAGDLGSISVAM